MTNTMKKISIKEAWLSEVANSEETRNSYKNIERFLEFCNCTLEDIENEWDNVTTYREEKIFKKKWTRKIKQHKAILNQNENLAQGTIETYMAPIASFFRYLETPIKVPRKTKSITYHNRDIQREEIDSIISNTSHIRDQTFYYMMTQTGLRPIVLSRLQYRDIKEDWEKNIAPCRIHVPKNKNKGEYKEHYTFMAQESIELLRKYFDSRFGLGKNPSDDDLLFSQSNTENIPISTESEANIFSRVALKLGIAEREENKKSPKYGKPKAIRMYNLRKFFRNNIVDSPEIDGVDCHFFMGHKLDKNDEHYFSAQNVEKFRKKYDKASEFIKITSIPDTYKDQVKYLETQLEQTRKEMEKRVQEEVQKQIRGIISEELHKMVESDPQTKHVVEDFIQTQLGVNPERVSYNVTVSENNSKTITVLGYWRNAKYVKLERPATITTQ